MVRNVKMDIQYSDIPAIYKVFYTLEDYNQIHVPFFDNNIASGIYILSFDLDGTIINKKITHLK
mgnify:CR=1 FL=1